MTGAFGYLFNEGGHKELNKKNTCTVGCTLVTYKDGTQAWVPTAVAADVLAKDMNGGPVSSKDVAKTLIVVGATVGTVALIPTGIPEGVAVGAATVGEWTTVAGLAIDPSTDNFVDAALGKLGNAVRWSHNELGQVYQRIYNAYEWAKVKAQE